MVQMTDEFHVYAACSFDIAVIYLPYESAKVIVGGGEPKHRLTISRAYRIPQIFHLFFQGSGPNHHGPHTRPFHQGKSGQQVMDSLVLYHRSDEPNRERVVRVACIRPEEVYIASKVYHGGLASPTGSHGQGLRDHVTTSPDHPAGSAETPNSEVPVPLLLLHGVFQTTAVELGRVFLAKSAACLRSDVRPHHFMPNDRHIWLVPADGRL